MREREPFEKPSDLQAQTAPETEGLLHSNPHPQLVLVLFGGYCLSALKALQGSLPVGLLNNQNGGSPGFGGL